MTYNCWDCGQPTPRVEAKQFADHVYCMDCYHLAIEGTYGSSCEAEAELDTPSLADHPMYDYITNRRGHGY